MPSPTDIANRALAHLGQNRVTSIDERTVEADIIRDVYDEVRKGALRAHPWNFAIRRAVLGPDTTAPAFGWRFRFRKPAANEREFHAGWLRTLTIHDTDRAEQGRYHDIGRDPQIPYEDEGGFFLSNVDTLYLRYVADIPDINRWDSLAREYFALTLGAEVAIRFTESNTRQSTLYEMAGRKLVQARAVDGMDTPSRQYPIGSWERARIGGFFSNRGETPDA